MQSSLNYIVFFLKNPYSYKYKENTQITIKKCWLPTADVFSSLGALRSLANTGPSQRRNGTQVSASALSSAILLPPRSHFLSPELAFSRNDGACGCARKPVACVVFRPCRNRLSAACGQMAAYVHVCCIGSGQKSSQLKRAILPSAKKPRAAAQTALSTVTALEKVRG